MNCTPNTLCLVKRASICKPCSAKVVGLPTKVSHVITPLTLPDVFQERVEGPVWMLAQPFRCPFGVAGCDGVDRMPDARLQPFDPASEPEPEAEDLPAGVPVAAGVGAHHG